MSIILIDSKEKEKELKKFNSLLEESINVIKNINKNDYIIFKGNKVKNVSKEILPQHSEITINSSNINLDIDFLNENSSYYYIINKEEFKDFDITKSSKQIKNMVLDDNGIPKEEKRKIDVSIKEIIIEENEIILKRTFEELNILPKELHIKKVKELDKEIDEKQIDSYLDKYYDKMENKYLTYIDTYILEDPEDKLPFEELFDKTTDIFFLILDIENNTFELKDSLEYIEGDLNLVKLLINKKYIFGIDFKKEKERDIRTLLNIPKITIYKNDDISLIKLEFLSTSYTFEQKYIVINY